MWKSYFDKIKKFTSSNPDYTEFTFRTPLENLLNSLKPSGITIIHEPKREKGFGAPDFKVVKSGGIMGYIEVKKLGENLDNILKTDQLKRYKKMNSNIILTNYNEFIWLRNGEILERETFFYLTDLSDKQSNLKPKAINSVESIFNKFFLEAPEKIGTPKELSAQLAYRAQILREYINELLEKEKEKPTKDEFWGLYKSFKDTLIEDLSIDEFADAYAQTVVYSLFLSYLSNEKPITKESAHENIPGSFALLKEFFRFVNQYDLPSHIKWIFEEIINVINNIDLHLLYTTLSFSAKKKEESIKDPYIYFYEDFLKHYDKEKRKAKGVYYTPPAVVSFIVRSLNIILKEKFGKQNGFADHSVTVLDFACGTGTFLVYVFEIVFEELTSMKNTGSIEKAVAEHLLEHIYGFEYLVAPYAVAHLKLSQFLKDKGYKLKDSDRLNVFLTDTLDNAEHKINLLMPSLSKEGAEANKVKIREPILVILGNPPYNNKSRNNKKWIKELIKAYKKGLNERKINLDDDYIKFIRYAHWKMEEVNEGVIGIITNNSFIEGITHRKMRETLKNSFDEIYILNLHGNSNKKETCPDESKDENVFDIRVGVSISFFIKKNKEPKDCEVFYYDIYGKQDPKYKFLFSNDIKTLEWKKLPSEEPDFDFTKRDKSLEKLYKTSSYSILEIFQHYNSGIETKRDNITIHFNIEPLKEVVKDFQDLEIEKLREKYKLPPDGRDWTIEKAKRDLKKLELSDKYIEKIQYRPLDKRYTYFFDKSRSFIAYPRYNTMKHFLQPNLGLCFMRQVVLNAPYTHFLVIDKVIDRKIFGSSRGTAFVAPLYLYRSGLFKKVEGEKEANFKLGFQRFIKGKYTTVYTPEQILGYIYAIFHSPTYRKKYVALLKLDFPRVSFVDNEKTFKQLSDLGLELIEHHLMKKTYTKNIANYPVKIETEKDGAVEKVKYVESNEGKIFINDKQYFGNISPKIWEFQIGGYQVLDKWLKERKKHNRALSYGEIQTFLKIVNILDTTINLMSEINDLTKDWI